MYEASSVNEGRVQSPVPGLNKLNIFCQCDSIRDADDLLSGQEEQLAFKRTLSHLVEMTSSSYLLQEEWNPLPLTERKWERRVSCRLPGVAGRVSDRTKAAWAGERK